MYSDLWSLLMSKLTEQPLELQTIPTTNKSPIFFSLKKLGDKIIVDKANINVPSSKISAPRTLTKEEFQRVYPYYLRREQGEKVSEEVTKITRNQVYWYSIIKHLIQG